MEQFGSLESRLAASLLPQRVAATVSGSLGLVGLLLSAIGLYGVLGLWVSRRAHEIGVRVTLGAAPRDVVGLVLGQGLRLAGAGILLGIPLAAAGARLFASFLLGLSAADLPTYRLVSVLLLATAMAASLVPARRAMRADPMAVLRRQ